MCTLRPFLAKLLERLPPPPADEGELKKVVSSILADAKPHASSENWKNQWEYLLKDEIFKLAMKEGKALRENSEAYYEELRDKLDLVLLFTEQDACEQTFPFVVLQDLLESQTIDSCSQIFSWIEDRAARLTEGLIPQKGKALILLRTLNDLLRRLSKMGSTTIFCGRILTFLSGVFPLGERSGVNLRGEYGPAWEGVSFESQMEKVKAQEVDKDVDMAPADEGGQDDKIMVDATSNPANTEDTEAKKKAELYDTFWSLQLYFSKPTVFATPGTLEEFKGGVARVMPVIKEATAKERAMMGSRNLAGTAASLKRKREPEPEVEGEETNLSKYFFAKFLTSPDLLDLEIADTHFRRQFLLQLLILLNHLLTFTKEAKETWATSRNRSLQMDFTLEPPDAEWVQEWIKKAMEELKQTTPNGRQFADTVSTILEREKNWIRWKNELCAPFDKEPWSEENGGQKVGLWEATRPARTEMQKPPEPWKWKLGSAPLSQIWDQGYKDLSDLEQPYRPGDVRSFVLLMKQVDFKTSEEEEAAVYSLHPSLPPKPGSPFKVAESSRAEASEEATDDDSSAPKKPRTYEELLAEDNELRELEEQKKRIAWLALRPARETYLQHFGKIGTGDIVLLAQEIENERKKEAERATKEESNAPSEDAGLDEKMEG
ncbi:hypothetical protein NMY22_g12764 [Coprinellus aureogranulatus]|nr:hypothetical protein NMY22_g12764 [Coprinellus aureogranulatus]